MMTSEPLRNIREGTRIVTVQDEHDWVAKKLLNTTKGEVFVELENGSHAYISRAHIVAIWND